MENFERELSEKDMRVISRALADLSDDQADRVAVLLAERGPLAGALGPEGEQRERLMRYEVEELIIVVFDQHILDATEPDRKDKDLAFFFEAVAEVRRHS